MSWDSFIDPIASFFEQDAESQVQQGTHKTGLDGKYKPGLADQFWGRANDGQTALDTQKATSDRKAGERLLAEAGHTSTSLGLDPDTLTPTSVGSALREYNDKKDKDRRQDDLTATLKPLEMRLAADDKTRQGELALAREKLAQSNNLAMLQLADSKDARIAELQYQKLRDRKTDQQYNERMELLDRKDRKQAMSSLAAGIAALGAAFAI